MTTERRDELFEDFFRGIPEEEITDDMIDDLKGTYAYMRATAGDKVETLIEDLKLRLRRMNRMNTLKIRKLHPDAIIPTRAHPTDAGLDIYAIETIVLRPQEKHLLATGIAVDIPPGYVGLLTSRSGVSSKTNLVIETGKIDAGYNGEMKVNIKNDEQRPSHEVTWNNQQLDKPFEPLLYDVKGEKVENGNPYAIANGKDYLIQKGAKIAQLVIQRVELPEIEVVEDFESKSARGENGFGSTGER